MINISEGRDTGIVHAVADAGGQTLLDVHTDRDHNRSVLTLGGPPADVEEAARRVVAEAVGRIDIRTHRGVHPRLGAADVVPFVPLAGSDLPADSAWSSSARDRFAQWAGGTLDLPCFLYGPERTLPEVRKGAFLSIAPDAGPSSPHPTAGATAVGARPVLIAYNLWIVGPSDAGARRADDVARSVAREVAAGVRGPALRTLGLAMPTGAQVSCNLVDVESVSVLDAYDRVAAATEERGCSVLRAELVGLVPAVHLAGIPRHRWDELDLSEARTIESRLARTAGG